MANVMWELRYDEAFGPEGGLKPMATPQITDATPPGGGQGELPFYYSPEVFEGLLKEASTWWLSDRVRTHRAPVLAALRIAAEVARIAEKVDAALAKKGPHHG